MHPDAAFPTRMSKPMVIFPHIRSRRAFAAVIAAALVLAGCVSDPNEDDERTYRESPSLQSASSARTKTPASLPGGSYRIVKGDTLYSISFKRGLDYRDVAAWNDIAAPQYKILVGQVIRLSPPGTQAAAVAESRPQPQPQSQSAPSAPIASASSAPPTARTDTAAAPKNTGMFEDVPSEPAPIAHAPPSAAGSMPDTNATRTPTAPATSATSMPAAPLPTPPVAPPPVAAVAAKPAVETPPAAKPNHEVAVANTGGVAWRWPNHGKLVGGYVAGDQTRQGIDIAGAAGDPVLAAADGEVVYSGNGLFGYGELIIVKHNDTYLSAYGHNRKRLVAEGAKVRAGQQIAEMGSSASARDELHFEIRKNGKPVNPMDYLPAR